MTVPSSADPMRVFDRRLVRLHRDRAAPGLAGHDFLLREIAARLVDRLDDVTRRFAVAVDLGCHSGSVAAALAGRDDPQVLLQLDLSERMAALAQRGTGRPAAVADEEMLPLAPASLDLVLSCLSLHWVNDLPGTLLQLRQALRPDGLLLAAMLGGETLKELRAALLEAEAAVSGGVAPRVSPFADVRDLGGLLQRAGFALPVVDSDVLTVTYPDALALMRDLRGMGESNALLERAAGGTRRAVLLHAAALYESRFADADGRLPATFQVLYMTAWAPHPDQQRPLRPGSARARLAEALDSTERPAGDKADPDAGC